LIGRSTILQGVETTKKTFQCPQHTALYWKQKVLNPLFHSNPIGGARNFKFSSAEQALLEACLWMSVRENPCKTMKSHQKFLADQNYNVQPQFIDRIFKRWKWTWKRPIRRQIEKYSISNIRRYFEYLYGVHNIPLERLKFLDEAHFVSKTLHRHEALGEMGEPVFVITSAQLDVSYSLTLMTTLSDPLRCCIIDLRENSNTQWDFASFLLFCLEQKHLTAGDYLILDNASVHVGANSFTLIKQACDLANVKIIFLPAYSPELNPCELVFAQVKNYMRLNRSDDRMWVEMLYALTKVTQSKLQNMYNHCLHSWRYNMRQADL